MNKKNDILRLLHEGKSYGQIVDELGCSKATISFHATRAGYSGSNRDAGKRYKWEDVQRYHDEGHSYRECMEHFGFTSGAWHKAVKRGVLRPRSHVKPIDFLLVEERSDKVKTGRQLLKKRLITAKLLQPQNGCANCGITEWMGEPIVLELDHINGKRHDNRIENLRLLCPNCHSQTPTYGSRNARRVQAV